MGINGIAMGGYGTYGLTYNNPLSADNQAEASAQLRPGQAPKEPGGDKDKVKKPGYKSSPEECQTCKTRKYQDGSNEMDVSFKTPGHIDPGNAASVVLSHEQQHVANAFQDAAKNNGKVERASVTLKTDICPECGRSYISGGETNTQIKYYNEDNPYQKALKESDADNKLRGAHVDVAA